MPALVDKYRPKTLDDIKGQDHVILRLKEQIKKIHASKDGDMPNLFFSGAAGTGKNCAIECFMTDCFGKDWNSNWTPLNASDDRRIETVRTKIKDAAKRAVISTYVTKDGREKDMPFNMIFLDEADALTPDAQGALRRIIEEYSHITRFVFSCNYSYKIIDPIISRCMVFKFKRISPSAMKEILSPIIEQENIKISDDALELLCKVCKGDARKAENMLQNCTLGTIGTQGIDRNIVNEVANQLTEKVDMDLVLNFVSDFNKYYDDMWNYLEGLFWDKGQDTTSIIYAIVEGIKDDDNMPIVLKQKILLGAGETLYRCSLQDEILHIMNWLWSVK